jgi:beta-glucosidase
VDVDVSNRSQRAGDEVVELYLNFPQAPGAPRLALRGFERVHLAAGAKEHVHLDVSSRDLSLVTEAGDRVIAGGEYRIAIGGGQPGGTAPWVQANFVIEGNKRLPE